MNYMRNRGERRHHKKQNIFDVLPEIEISTSSITIYEGDQLLTQIFLFGQVLR